MKAFHSLVLARTLRFLAVVGIVGTVLCSTLPTTGLAKPLPVENGDPTDVDYGPSPKKAADFGTVRSLTSVESPARMSRGGHRSFSPWLADMITMLWRVAGLR